MSPLGNNRWLAVSRYLDRALELSGEERAAWLNAVRAEDESLAADLGALLAEHDALVKKRFLEDAPGVSLARLSMRTPT